MLQLQLRGGNIYDHSGVSMVLECVMKHSKSTTVGSSTVAETTKPNKDFTNFIGQMNEKYNFVGCVLGLSKNSSPNGMVYSHILYH